MNEFDTESLNAPFTRAELKAAIRQTRADSAPGEDCITYSMIKHLPGTCRNVLLSFYNRLYQEGHIMEQWKQSIVLPFIKQGKDTFNPLSYRPISLTSILCKINERLITNRLSWYMTSNKLLNPLQSDFRSNRSTVDHLTRLADKIYKANNVGHYTQGDADSSVGRVVASELHQILQPGFDSRSGPLRSILEQDVYPCLFSRSRKCRL